MKILIPALLAAILLLPGCQKEQEPQAPFMKYIDLHNQEVAVGQLARLDLDSNQVLDFVVSQHEYFSIIEQAMKQVFYIGSFAYSFALTDLDSNLPVFRLGDDVRVKDTEELVWANVSQMTFALKTTYSADGSVVWVGDWLNQSHQYIPIKISNPQGQAYTGWIEASFDVNREIITLHRAALSRHAGRDARAGE